MEKRKQIMGRRILRWGRIGRIATLIAERLNISPLEALRKFYRSEVCRDFHDDDSELRYQGDLYVVADFLKEIGQ